MLGLPASSLAKGGAAHAGGGRDADTLTAARRRELHEPFLGTAGPRLPGLLLMLHLVSYRRGRWRLSPPAWLLTLPLLIDGVQWIVRVVVGWQSGEILVGLTDTNAVMPVGATVPSLRVSGIPLTPCPFVYQGKPWDKSGKHHRRRVPS